MLPGTRGDSQWIYAMKRTSAPCWAATASASPKAWARTFSLRDGYPGTSRRPPAQARYRRAEIGPGIGPLTVQLARRAAKVAAIELDRTLYPILAETLAPYPNAEVVPGDAMKLDLAALVSDKFSGLTAIACANLPYNITTPVLTALIEAGCFASITVMIQREVALRICAAPGSSDYGAFSVFCQYHTQPELLFEVGPECFLPAPQGHFGGDPARPRSAPPQNLVDGQLLLPGGQSLLRPAAQDAPQRPLLRLRQPPVQRRAARGHRGRRAARRYPGRAAGYSLNLPLWPPPSRTVSEPVYRAVFANSTKDLQKPPVSLQYS